MKIVLAALNAKYIHSNLAVYNLEAYAKKKWQEAGGQADCAEDNPVEILVREYTINHNLDSILQLVYQEQADVVAFSCYIWNVGEVLAISRELSKVSPDCHIWLGGPEVSYHGEEILAKHPYIEGIMVGEGEETFYELTKLWLEVGRVYSCQRQRDGKVSLGEDASVKGAEDSVSYANVRGILYRDGQGEICRTPARPLLSLDEVPFVYQDLEKFKNRILYYETSRGCPFSCSYCLSSIDKTVRFRSLSLVEKELQFFLDNKVSQVKFIDRTFNCKKEHSLAVWRYITEHDNGVTNFHFEVSADLISNEELELFAHMRPGLIQLEIGLQSTNPATIREIHRTMDVEKVKEGMLAIESLGNIHQHLDLIAGLPYEDFVTFKQSFDDAYAMKPNQLQLGFLKVLKGSYMEEQAKEYKLQYQESQPYEVLSTKWISYDELIALKKVEEMVEIYYNSDQFEYTLPYVIPFFKSPFEFYQALGNYYEKHKLSEIGFKREARYEILLDFCCEYFGKCDKSNENCLNIGGKELFSMELVKSLLTFDYYLRENAKSRPLWAKEEPIEKEVYQNFFRQGGTKEYRIDAEGYDSKVAARKMHMEPVCREALPWIVKQENSKAKVVDRTVVLGYDVERQEPEEQGRYYCLFDYEKRDRLSKGAKVTVLRHL